MVTPTASAQEVNCVICGTAGAGRFCSNCGEPLRRHDYSMRHLLHEAFHFFTDLDSSPLRTLYTLLQRPGELTRAYFEGPRKRYLKPFQIFLVCNVIFFILQSAEHFVAFSAPFHGQIHEQYYSRYVYDRGVHAEQKSGLPPQVFEQIFDRETEHLSKAMIIVLVPVLALILFLSRPGNDRWFAEHVVFSMHVMAFYLLALVALEPAIFFFLRWLGSLGYGHYLEGWPERVLVDGFGNVVPFGVYLGVAMRRYYHLSIAGAMGRAVLIAPLLLPIMVLYRWLLFYLTLWTL